MTTAPPLLPHKIEGSGPPLVLLNGGMMTIDGWEPIATPFERRFEVLRFDFRGQLLALGPGPGDLAGHANDLETLLDHLGWTDAHFVGVSFGSEVATELLTRAPHRFRSFVAITAMDRETPEFRRQSEEMQEILARVANGSTRERFFEVLLENVYSETYRRAETAAFAGRRRSVDLLPRSWFTGVSQLLDALHGFDLGPGLDDLQAPCPTLALLAAHDRVMAEDRALALANALNAEIEIHAEAGHGLVIEDPDWVVERCLGFLERIAETPEASATRA